MKNTFFYREFYKRNLPHYQPENGIFFITTRLVNSLPNYILNELKTKKDVFEKSIKNINACKKKELIQEFHKDYFINFDEFLDKFQESPKWLNKTEIAEVVKKNLFFWNNERYKLLAYCIMPNHIHIMIKPSKTDKDVYESLTKIMFGMKSYTANECNKILHRTGQFWHHESYDHYIRDVKELWYYVDYILKNPVKAGLVTNWEEWDYNWVLRNWEDVEI
ncbi:MAG: transposase [Candidatus Cloacimonetes bacterium]|nr:transposase [Candidatus Cloacimonadota bacterium]